MPTNSSDKNASPTSFKDVGQATSSPPSKTVNDFHRNSDVDHRAESQHHTIGTSRYNAAAGDHIHDGSTGSALLDGVTFTGNAGSTDDQHTILKDITAALVNLGAEDNTTDTGSPFKYYTEKINIAWAGGSAGTPQYVVSFPAGLFTANPLVVLSRLTGGYSGPCETRITVSALIGGVTVNVRTTDGVMPAAGTSTWIYLLAIGV